MDLQRSLSEEETSRSSSRNILGLLPLFVLVCIVVLRVSWVLYRDFRGQKTRTQQQRRMYGSPRTRSPSDQEDPTIFVSPANLPPPPKYEALAPPSYEEAVRVNYEDFQRTQVQPITYPLTHAAAQSSSSANVTTDEPATVSPSTVITVTADNRRTSVTTATQS
ncbi:uncharacterized protein ACR2FA_007229 isoform 1-T1 [Aphomia sociella]